MLLRVPPDALSAIARTLRIVDHRTATTRPWVPHAEQEAIWAHCHKHSWVFAAKPRRVGATTAVQLDDMVWCKINDANGDRVRAGLFCDIDDTLSERIALATSWIEQSPRLFKGCEINNDRLLYPGGSVLEWHTGSGKNAGRGGGYQRLHLTEVPFWQREETLGGLLPSMSMESQVIIETTIDVTGPNGLNTQNLWDDKSNRFERLFFKVTDHDDYVRPANLITDEQWKLCQAEGFDSREHAAWWLTEALPNLCAGDLHRLMREFPQTESHLFSLASGLWVKQRTDVIKPVDVVDVEGHKLLVYKPLAATSKQIVIAVDVAKGAGGDASVIAVVDKLDGSLCAMLHDNSILTTTLARATKIAHDLYTVPATERFYGDLPAVLPEVLYETNGVGTGPMQYARELGMAVIDVHLSGAEGASCIYDCLLLAKEAAELGILKGPRDLATECGELHRDPVTGKWRGRKDGLVAYGHARRWMRVSPYKHAPIAVDPHKVDGKRIIRSRLAGSNSDW